MTPNEPPEPDQEFAWRVHSNLNEWTARVDTKASIALAIEAAAFGFVLTLSDDGRQLASLHGACAFWFGVGLGFLLLSILLSLMVVTPQLNWWRSRKDWQANTIYFGHLRHWNATALARKIEQSDGTRSHQLAAQLIVMSKIAWRKHVWLQLSLLALAIGSAILLVVGISS